MSRLHEELERENDVRRRPVPQFLPCPCHKFTPPFRGCHSVVLRAVALCAAQPIRPAQGLARRIPTPPVQIEQAVVRVRGDMAEVLAERRIEHVDAQRMFRRQLRLFLQVEARRDCEYTNGRRLEKRWGNEQHAQAIHDCSHVVFRRRDHYEHQHVEGGHLWVWHGIEEAKERVEHRGGFRDVQDRQPFARITFRLGRGGLG